MSAAAVVSENRKRAASSTHHNITSRLCLSTVWVEVGYDQHYSRRRRFRCEHTASTTGERASEPVKLKPRRITIEQQLVPQRVPYGFGLAISLDLYLDNDAEHRRLQMAGNPLVNLSSVICAQWDTSNRTQNTKVCMCSCVSTRVLVMIRWCMITR